MGVWAEKGLGKKRRGQDPRLGWVWCYLVWIKGTGESVVSEAALTGLEAQVWALGPPFPHEYPLEVALA